MNFKKNKAFAIAATVAMALSVPSFAQLLPCRGSVSMVPRALRSS